MAHHPPTPDAAPLRYGLDPWTVRATDADRAFAGRDESIFAVGNGRLGLRGDVEEASGVVRAGTFLNGFHETFPIHYPEWAYGYATTGQTMIPVADGKRVELWVGDEPLDLSTGTVTGYARELEMRAGIVRRRFRWRPPSGTATVEVETVRLVSLARPEIAAIRYAVRVVEGAARLRLASALDAGPARRDAEADPRLGSEVPTGSLVTYQAAHDEEGGGHLLQRTLHSGMHLAAAVAHAWTVSRGGPDAVSVAPSATHDRLALTLTVDAEDGDALVLEKHLAYVTPAPSDVAQGASPMDLLDHADAAARAARDAGVEALLVEQQAALDGFWQAADIVIDGDPALQQGLRFAVLALYQSAGRDGRTNLAAKGLTGEGYEGHYFWDTEVFALPVFDHVAPAVARALLDFRVATLPQARARARELGEAGALYPWRTINGEEASAYFPAGTAQYHIDADVALAVRRYVDATGDWEWLARHGAEVVLETARMWMTLGAYIDAQGGAFCINGVTGPDEYSALVDNNGYTNLVARAHLRYAAALADELPARAPDAWAALQDRIALAAEEPAAWRDAAERMRIPYDRERGIQLQDDTFLELAPWDFAATPRSMYPLLLHVHPLVIYRHQVLKQPDVVLAQVLLSDEIGLADKRRNFAFYDPLTTGDSSLAPCIQGIAAAEIGEVELAHAYFMRTARMDLDDVNANTAHGLHMASAAGAWNGLVAGFGGLRLRDGVAAFAPRLPSAWERLRFRLRLAGSLLQVTITHTDVQYEVLEGAAALQILHFGAPVDIAPGSPVVLDLRPVLRAVVFDLDGVITSTAEYHYRSWKRLADELHVPFDRTSNERLKGVGRLESLDIILASGGLDLPAADREALAARKNGYYKELIAGIAPDDVYPGVRALLADLRAAGVRTAIASASHNVGTVLAGLGLDGAFDHVVDPATVVRGKPDPEVFLRAAEALGVRPVDCAGVEDAQVGVEAIAAAGMLAVGVGTGLAGADLVVERTGELTVELLRRLVRGRAAG